MSTVKLFKRDDLSFDSSDSDLPAAVNPVVNVAVSSTIGGGIGVFEAGFDMDWTVTYDELIFIHEGDFTLQVGENQAFDAEPGDVLWIPAGTHLRYQAESDVTFFYAVYPVTESPSTGKPADYPSTAPRDLE